MGKVFGYNKPKLISLILLSLLLLIAVNGDAAYREYDLLQKGYESYLSYQPEKAAEEFRTFLREFPRSSARDAALFWLGKSLIQLKSIDDAGKVFDELKQQCSDSPFIAFIGRESEITGRSTTVPGKEPEYVPVSDTVNSTAGISQSTPDTTADHVAIAPEQKTDAAAPSDMPAEKETENTLQTSETIAQQITDIQPLPVPDTVSVKTGGDQEYARPPAEPETKPAADMMQKTEEPVVNTAEVKETAAEDPGRPVPVGNVSASVPSEPALPEPQKNSEDAGVHMAEERKALPDEASHADEVKISAAGDPTSPETVVTEKAEDQEPVRPQSETEPMTITDMLSKTDGPVVKETERREPEEKISEVTSQPLMTDASFVLHKIGIQGALWMTGDSSQDFENEQLLLEEAKKLDIPVDENRVAVLAEQYTLNEKEADYLKRFLRICHLIDKKVLEIPQERVVEVLSVKYEGAKQQERSELAAELQTFAKNGVTFENISRSYPDVVDFKAFAFEELPVWIQERIQGIQNNEIGVVWSEEGYMILKPIVYTLSFDPFEEIPPEKKEKILTFLRSWIRELKEVSSR